MHASQARPEASRHSGAFSRAHRFRKERLTHRALPFQRHMHEQSLVRSVQDCDISSATGTGVGSEGGQLSLVHCHVHDCKRHGAAIFGDLQGLEGANMKLNLFNHIW